MLEIIKIIVLACQTYHMTSAFKSSSLDIQRQCQRELLKCYQTNSLKGIDPSKVLADCLAKGK